MEHLKNSMMFRVKVPVLSERMVFTIPSSCKTHKHLPVESALFLQRALISEAAWEEGFHLIQI